jgi:hypothetical protein
VNEFSIELGEKTLTIDPTIYLSLDAENTLVPIDLKNNVSNIAVFDFAGTFRAGVNVGVEGIPVELYISASSDDIVRTSSIDFEVGVDIDLFPLRDTMIGLLEDLSVVSYPRFIQQSAPFLPRLDLSCVSRSGTAYLGGTGEPATFTPAPTTSDWPSLSPSSLPSAHPSNDYASTKYPISGFLNAIADGCSTKELDLSGGYNSTSQELGAYCTILILN